jgi:hypothetical protein
MEQNGDQLTGIGINLVCKILDAGAATQAKYRAAITAWHNCATKAWCGALFKLFAFRTF